MSTLNTELQARARWVGLCAARRLTRDASAWVAATRDASALPPSVRVEVRRELDRHDVEAFALEAIGTLAKRVSGLDGRVWIVGDAGWWAWFGGGLVESREGIGAMRSEGAVILALGAHAGQTLDVVGETLDASMPTTIGDLLRRTVASGANREKLHEAEQRLQWAWNALGAKSAWLLDVCLDAGAPWWNAQPDLAAQGIFELLASKAGGVTLPHALPLTKRAAEAMVTGAASGKASKSPGPAGQATVDSWLKQRNEDYATLNDSGLEVIFKGEHWKTPTATRDAMLIARLAAAKPYRKDAKRPDFARLAPLPELGSKRGSATLAPGLPLLDAVWFLRKLLEAFPGQIAGGHAVVTTGLVPHLRVTKVVLRLRDVVAPECVLYPSTDDDYGRVRAFGLALVERVTAKKPGAFDAVYEVAVFAEPEGAAPIELAANFPWRWSEASPARRDAMKADATCFSEARAALEVIARNALRKVDVSVATAALATLQSAWDVLRAVPVIEHAGMLESGTAPWAPARNFINGYTQAAEALIEVFEHAGNLAARIAEGPLHTVLQFGLHGVNDAWRLYGYHPLRLARLLEQEQAALGEITESLSRLSSLRDVPLFAMPPLAGAPTVLWNASEETQRQVDPPPFLVAASASSGGDDPWSERYVPFAHRGDTESDLVEPLRPVLDALATLFPGMSRRASVLLSSASHTDRGMRPLLLMADAVQRVVSDRRIVQGIDLHVPDGMVSAHLESDDETESDRLATITEAMSTTREDDAHFPLEIFIDAGASAGGTQPDHHLALMVRPSAKRSKWSTRATPKHANEAAAMVWEPDARAYNQIMVPGANSAGPANSATLEQLFQRLVVLRWRREADAMPRCLGLSLEGSEDHPDGRPLLQAVRNCARRAARVIVVDRSYGAEAIDVLPPGDDLHVTYADFHREQGWRITVIANRSWAPDRERVAVKRGLMTLFRATEADVEGLAPWVYDATHRAVPEVFRALCGAGSARRTRVDGELVGHLGVALFMSRLRGPCAVSSGAPWPAAWARYEKATPEGTLLLSMDSLQRWTWTRRSGTRGDFLALVPDGDSVRMLAIESKGSEGAHLVDGTSQAEEAAAKLLERFGAAERLQERRELLRCVAEESFRASRAQRAVYDAISEADSLDATRFEAVCVSTAVEGSDLSVGVHPARLVLWVRVAGIQGLRRLAGLP